MGGEVNIIQESSQRKPCENQPYWSLLDRSTGAIPSFLASCGACVAHDHRPGSKSGVIGSSGDRAGPGRGFSIQLCTLVSGG